MNRTWYGVAALAGVLAAVPAWVWPNAPLWQRSRGWDDPVLGFGTDGRLFVLTEVSRDDKSRVSWAVDTLDALTGALLARTPRPEFQWGGVYGRTVPGGRYVVFWYGGQFNNVEPVLTFDLLTGRPVGSPLVGHDLPGVRPFCDDGRLYVTRSCIQPELGDGEGWSLVETTTGRIVASWCEQCRHDPDAAGQQAATEHPAVQLAPDGRTVAVLWRPLDPPGGPSRLELIDTDTLRVVRTMPIPAAEDGYFSDYDGQRVYFFDLEPDGAVERLTCRAIDVSGGRREWRREPHRDSRGYLVADEPLGVQRGPGWVAKRREESAGAAWWQSAARRFRDTVFRDGPAIVVSDVTTGRVRGSVPFDREFVVSDDGWRVACVDGQVVRVYEIAPPRAARAAVAGWLAALAVVAARAFRRRTAT